jgi:hypothetical protein
MNPFIYCSQWRYYIISGGTTSDTSTKTSSNLALFVKINKSGDGGPSGDILDTLTTSIKSKRKKIMMSEINSHLVKKVK